MRQPTKALLARTLDELIVRLSRPMSRTPSGWTYLPQVPLVVCLDGFTMSVQASETHYCSPRLNFGPWTAVEVGFPSQRVNMLEKYRERLAGNGPTNSVYPYVPIEIVAKVIAWHGGFAPTEMGRLVAEFTGKVTEDE